MSAPMVYWFVTTVDFVESYFKYRLNFIHVGNVPILVQFVKGFISLFYKTLDKTGFTVGGNDSRLHVGIAQMTFSMK